MVICAAAIIITIIALCAHHGARYKKYSKTYFGAFDTITIITGYARSERGFEKESDSAFEIMMSYHREFDAFSAYEGVNNIYALNERAARAPVIVTRELFDALAWAKRAYTLSESNVNAALGAVTRIWHEYREAGVSLPEMSALNESARHVNIDDVVLDEAQLTVYYKDPLLKLDLGALAKGYATEKAAQALLAGGMPSFIINAGGNVRAGQKPRDGRASWLVGISDPDGDESIAYMRINDMSAVTSGDYQRYYTIEGVRYNHIIDTETLMPAAYMRAATVTHPDSAMADLLSTAIFLMPCSSALEYIESIPGAQAYIITLEGEYMATSGMSDLLTENQLARAPGE